MIKALYKVSFTEIERGWGQRPDGYILTKSKEIAETIAKEYCNKCNNPNEYSIADSEPYLIEVDDLIYNQVIESKDGYKWY